MKLFILIAKDIEHEKVVLTARTPFVPQTCTLPNFLALFLVLTEEKEWSRL